MLLNHLRKALACLSAGALLATCVPAGVLAAEPLETFTCDGVTYTVTSAQEVSVGAQLEAGTAFAAAGGDVRIPAEVNGYTVTGVTPYAFSSGTAGAPITSLSLPATVTTIGANAFQCCTELASVSFGTNAALQAIGAYAFYGCSKLTAIEIPAQVTSIGRYGFANCPSLSSLAFQDPAAPEPPLTCSEGAFCLSSSLKGSLETVTLPARLTAVADYLFSSQDALRQVQCAGGSLSRIGTYAFYTCTALETLTIPALTTSYTKIGANALVGLNSLKTLVFLGDEDYSLSKSSFGYASNVVDTNTGNKVTRYPSIETIVYYGTHNSDIAYSNPTVYQAVYYYSSREEAEAQANPLDHAVIRADVPLKDVAANASGSDARGPYLLEGRLPDAGSGRVWHYAGADASSYATTRLDAFPVPATNLSYGTLLLEHDTFTYDAQPVNITCTGLLAPSGAAIADYQLSVTDAAGAALALDAVTAVGTYTVSATAPGFSGAATTTVTIEPHACAVTRASGTVGNSMPVHMADTAFSSEDTDTVILVDASALVLGAAAGGLAGVRDALIIATDDDVLSLEALRNLKSLQPESVFLLGIEDADGVTAAIEGALGAGVSVTNAFTAATPALTAYNLYQRTVSAGYWRGQGTALVASSADKPGAVVAGAYAYGAKAPVFLTEGDGSLPATVAQALAGGFENVVLVGEAARNASPLGAQLAAAGYQGSLATWQADDAYQLCAQVMRQRIDAGAIGLDGVTFVNPNDLSSAITAISTCGRLGAPLLFADETAAGLHALETLVAPRRYEVERAFVFGTRDLLPEQFFDRLQRLWSTGAATDLSLGTMALERQSYAYDGSLTLPIATVRDAGGATLTAGTDYTLSYYFDRTDRRVLASSACPGAGTYTVIATGTGAYTGSCSARFSIVGTSLSSVTLTLEATSCAVTGSKVKPAVTARHAGSTLTEGSDFAVAYENNVAPGTATAVVTGLGAYTGSVRLPYAIEKPSVAAAAVTFAKRTFNYTGKALRPSPTVTLGGTTLQEGTDYTLSYSSNVRPGTARVTVTGCGSYAGSAQGTFTIAFSGPKGTKVKNVKRVKKRAKVTWKAQTSLTTGYQIQYSTKASLKNAKTKKVSGAKKTSVTVKGLKQKKTYYFRICTYTKIGSKTYRSAWSAVRKAPAKGK